MWLYVPTWEDRNDTSAISEIKAKISAGLPLPEGVAIAEIIPLGRGLQSWGWLPNPTPRALTWLKGDVMNFYRGVIYPSWDLTEMQATVAGRQILVYDGESLTLGGYVTSTGNYSDPFPFRVQKR